tara:strand:+ start:44688 stop:45716 length:1029 start_codon:yes stop_codon:yes gene_type:complete
MEIEKSKVIEALNLVPIGGQGFYTSPNLSCSECGKKEEKFGIKFIGDGGLVNCWVCNHKSSIFNYLRAINKDYLISYDHQQDYGSGIKVGRLLENDNYFKNVETLPQLPEISVPRGYTRVLKNSYLQGRGITPEQLERFLVGTVNNVLYPELRDYLIFQIFQNNRLVALLARTPFDKDWHDKNLKDNRLGKCKLKPRYWNTKGVEFQDILGGLDDIKDETDTVIVVEGLFDKLNMDNLLLDIKSLEVVYTFGHSFSVNQIKLLKSKGNVKTVIIMYDEDSLKQMKKTSMQLVETFDNVFVAPILSPGVDPGNISENQLSQVLQNVKDPVEYFSSIITIKIRK